MTVSSNSSCILVLVPALFLAGCPEASPPAGNSEPAKSQAVPEPAESQAVEAPKPTDSRATADTLVAGHARDPVCGMTIEVVGQPDSVYRDTRFHFCSSDCLQKFQADPSKAVTGLPQEDCVCTVGEMQNCDCGHCKGEPERCTCGDPNSEEDGDGDHSGHDHGGHETGGH